MKLSKVSIERTV